MVKHDSTCKLIDRLVEEGKPVSSVKIARIQAYTVLAVTFYAIALLLSLGIRADFLEALMRPAYLVELLICLFLVYGGSVSALWLAQPRIERLPFRWGFIMGAFTILAIFFTVYQIDSSMLLASFQQNLYPITLSVLSIASPVVVGLFFVLKRYAPTQPVWASLLALMSATAFGHMMMRILYSAENMADVMLWCYSPVLVMAFIGAALGRLILKW